MDLGFRQVRLWVKGRLEQGEPRSRDCLGLAGSWEVVVPWEWASEGMGKSGCRAVWRCWKSTGEAE